MKSTLKFVIIIIFAVQPTFMKPASALEIKDRNEFLIDVRGDDGNIYLNRVRLHKKTEPHHIEISLFGEAQWNFHTIEWEKLSLGMEAGKHICKFIYIGQSVQFISGQILDHMTFDEHAKSIDATTRLALHLPLIENFSLKIFEEISLNIIEGRNEYNETGAEITYTSRDSCSIGIGWRHTDRIHTFDTDYVSLSLTLDF